MTPGQSRNDITFIEAQRLRIHPVAQRDGIVRAKLRKFEKTLDLDAIGTLHAVRYAINGELAYWVIDGQHRLLALLNTGMGEWFVRVEVHVDVHDDKRASDLFLKLNDRSATNPHETFRNELQAGRPQAVAIANIVQRNGLRIAASVADGNITCISALRSTYGLDDGQSLHRTLGLLLQAWGPLAQAVEGKLVEGVGQVLAKYDGKVDLPGLCRKMAKYPGGPSALLGQARGRKAFTTRTVSQCVADVIVELHDHGRRSGALRGEATEAA